MSQKIWTAEKVRQIQQIDQMTDVTSLNTPMKIQDDDPNSELGDFIPDPSPGLEELAIQENRKEILLKVLDLSLTEREKDVILSRFGFSEASLILAEIGEKYNLTRERVRQIEERALKKIRKTLKSMGLNADNF